jgi:hypothetical protein
MDTLKNALKFIFPAIEILLGILLLAVDQQGHLFMIAGAAILASGIFTALFISNIIGKKLNYLFQAVILLAAVYFAYMDFTSVDSEIRYARKKARIDAETIQRLVDIRTAQQAYREVHGKYMGDLDSLIAFVKNDSINEIRAIGIKPDTLTLAEALSAGIIKRDTFKVSVLDTKFLNVSETAMKKRKYPFNIETMGLAPYSGKPFICQAGEIEVSGGIIRPVFEVKDPEPIEEPALTVGSMVEAHTNGNWKE